MKAKTTDTVDYIWRYRIVVSAIVFVCVLVAARSVHLHLFEGEFLRDEGLKRSLRVVELPANRGMILDRHGAPLAVATPLITLKINPQHVWEEWLKANEIDEKKRKAKKFDPDESKTKSFVERWKTAAVLAEHDSEELIKTIQSKAKQGSQFMYLKRWMEPERAKKVLSLKLAGIESEAEPKRYYPAANVVSHVVGITKIDKYGQHQGQEGLEYAFDERLKGVKGSRVVVKNKHGVVVEDLGIKTPAKPGEDIHLSLDLRAQYMAYRELTAAMDTHNATAGSVVAIDVETGELVAMVNYPSYNPNDRSKLTYHKLRNRAVTDVFEPGSTMKIFTIASALESGKYTARTPIDTNPGHMYVDRKMIRDHHNYGMLDVTGVITKSSNVGTSKIALSLDQALMRDMWYRIGLGQTSGVGFPGERTGRLPTREKLRSIEVATLSYGYGLSTTPLQIALAYAIIANQGVKLPLSILRLDHEIYGEQVLAPDIAQELVAMLETVVTEEGTANKAKVPGYRVAGKTGTVHKVGANGYEENNYLSWFAGFAPASDPKIAMVVVVDEPKGEEYYGGAVAAPVFSAVMGGILRVKNVVPDQATEPLLTANHKTENANKSLQELISINPRGNQELMKRSLQ